MIKFFTLVRFSFFSLAFKTLDSAAFFNYTHSLHCLLKLKKIQKDAQKTSLVLLPFMRVTNGIATKISCDCLGV